MCSRGTLTHTHTVHQLHRYSQSHIKCMQYVYTIHTLVNWRFSDLFALEYKYAMPPFIPFRIFQALSYTRTLTPTTYIQNVHDSSSWIEKTSACDAWFDSLFLFRSSSTSFCFKSLLQVDARTRKRRITYRFIGLYQLYSHSELWYFWLFSLWRITDEALVWCFSSFNAWAVHCILYVFIVVWYAMPMPSEIWPLHLQSIYKHTYSVAFPSVFYPPLIHMNHGTSLASKQRNSKSLFWQLLAWAWNIICRAHDSFVTRNSVRHSIIVIKNMP